MPEDTARRHPHITHIERNSVGRFYFWCEAPDCLIKTDQYQYEQDAKDAGRHHEEETPPDA